MRRGHMRGERKRRSTQASSARLALSASAEPTNTSPACAPNRLASAEAGATSAWRVKPPGWAARATVAHGPSRPWQIPHSTTTTEPAVASTTRQ
jgi:hypothetical protein